MKKELLISIVVPVYNGEKLLEKCITSIPKCDECEIIVVDDGSTDKTKAIINKLKKKDKRIVSIFKENGGVSSARNAGINKAKGKYIAFLDSDDYYEPNFFKEIVPYLKKKNPDYLTFNHYFTDDDTKKGCSIYPGKDTVTVEESITNFLNYRYINQFKGFPWNGIFKMSIIKDNDINFTEKLSLGEDRVFKIEYFMFIDHVNFLNVYLYNYYQNNNSATRVKYIERAIPEAQIFNECIIELIKKYNIDIDYKSDLARFYISRFYNLLENESHNTFTGGIDKFKEYRKYYIINHLKFSTVILKLKIYYILIKTNLWYFVYFLLRIRNKVKR